MGRFSHLLPRVKTPNRGTYIFPVCLNIIALNINVGRVKNQNPHIQGIPSTSIIQADIQGIPSTSIIRDHEKK